MISKVLFEIIIFTISMFSSGVNDGSFDLMIEGQRPISCTFQLAVSGGYDEYASSDLKLLIPTNGDDEFREFSVQLVDNALYEMTTADDAGPVILDIVPYLSTMDWDVGFAGQQTLFDSQDQELQISPFGDRSVIFSPSQKAVLIFSREFFAGR